MNAPVKLWFTDFWHPETEEAIRLNPVFGMLARRFDILLDRRAPDFLFYSCFGCRFLQYQCPRIFVTGENLRPDFAECDFALSFDPGIPGRNLRFPLYAWDDLSPLLDRPSCIAEKTEFCNFIYSNKKCAARNKIFRLLSAYKHVNSPGKLFNNMPRLPRGEDGEMRKNKTGFMRRYKFSIAFENESRPGYATEKIADAFAAGTVPVYWGSPNIAEEFNPDAFINCHDFPDLESAVRHIIAADQDDAQYARYLQAPPFRGNTLPPCAQTDRMLDFCAEIFARPPQQRAADSPYSRFMRRLPRFIAKRILRSRRRNFKATSGV